MSKVLNEEVSSQMIDTKQHTNHSRPSFQTVSESLDTCSYIMDPETCLLLFVSHNTVRRIPGAAVGKPCYEAIRGRQSQCKDCPIMGMLQNNKNEYTANFYNEVYQLWSRIDASIIQLPGNKPYGLLNCYNIVEFKTNVEDYGIDVNNFTNDVTLYDALCQSTDDYLYMCDMQKDLFYFPQSMVEEFNLPQQIIAGAVPIWSSYIHEDEREDFLTAMEDLASGKTDYHCQEYRARNKDGHWIWLRCRGYLEHDANGNPTLFAGVITNLGRKNIIDPLCGLLNKYEFEKLISSKLSELESEGVILLMGLDNFKDINDLYGWEFGDQIIRSSALKIQNLLPDRFQVYRLDGDKFGIYFNTKDISQVETLYQKISSVFKMQQECNGHRYYCTISGGYSIFSGTPISFHALFKQAEYALEYSKKEGKNRLSHYDNQLMGGKDRTLKIIERMRESVANSCSDFELHFQPQYDMVTHEINSAEALLRWHCEEYGSISPIEFIPLLEQTGLIHEVGRWVISQAVGVCKIWQDVRKDFTMSINLSFSQFKEKSLIPFLKQAVESIALDPSSLHLEITESCIASGSFFLTPAFQELRDIGFKIEMDDFGTGYSSLEILKNAPADIVKIDRAFVKDITKRDFDATFIRFVTSLCHSVDIKVCLEGVELWEEYNIVEPMGVDLIQGYLFGKPKSKAEFETLFLKPNHK